MKPLFLSILLFSSAASAADFGDLLKGVSIPRQSRGL